MRNDIKPEIDVAVKNFITTTKSPYTIHDIRSKSRKRGIVDLRESICIQLRIMGYSFADIGGAINREHCSVLHLTNHREVKPIIPQLATLKGMFYQKQKELLRIITEIKKISPSHKFTNSTEDWYKKNCK